MKISAVIFDWGGTLTPWHPVDLQAQWRNTFAHHLFGDDDVKADEFADALLAAEAWCWSTSAREHRSMRMSQVLQRAAETTGVDLALVDTEPAQAAYREFWEPFTFTDAQVRPLWTWLRGQGIKVGVLSNTMWSRDYHRNIFERDGVLDLIDGDIYSSEIEFVKPAAGAFQAAAQAVEADPRECVYVGDRLYEDIYGPQQIGMRTIHIPHSDIPAEQRVEVDAQPHAVAHELVQIAGIIRGWQGEP
ncbi:HAD family hydrolase [Ornithinimicrobium sp. INDO-MA30-4]|uniref:HAD family hydrolase n=1 Tax=Ornithinimicrobium sp. INDO-MA30-4 TaxID=2908651 RepID=UPI001F35BB89|nr:HAD family hydrolase [Ornithinimicrobium sp. INDO-MA30-4]UJH70851.1 HAD family hydrolase [Ornithinimicrobium sp. INDO-MA30-4]